MKIDNADHAKNLLARKLLYQSGHQIVTSEIGEFNNPDILSVTRSGKIIEYEIKVDKYDLLGELNSVNNLKIDILNNARNKNNASLFVDKVHLRGNIFVDEEEESRRIDIDKCSKFHKHQTYLIGTPSELNGYGYYEHQYRPNQFYFAVTSDLVELALEACEGLPYGVIDLGKIQGSSSIIKRAGDIHREEVSTPMLWKMAHSLSFGHWNNRHINYEKQAL